ncbi:MAG: PA2778 family cysteine peptidase [Gammaproteobacteria bacterium]|nr:PA2778 family cysteine peptidase [Gammaproteobacteria bacterium]
MSRGVRALTAAAALSLAACATKPPVLPALMPQATAPIELHDTPFFPQAEYQCGPAALATVLKTTGVAVQPDNLVDQVYVPARQGSLQVELLAATRRAGRIPYLIEPTLVALRGELEAGRPVLILQNLGLDLLPVWHYAVVVGIDPAGDQVILRSGVERRRHSRAAAFLRSWKLANNWGMVVLRPGEMPARATQQRLLEAIALAEPMLSVEARKRAYRAALKRWPASATARFGYAHALHTAGELSAAEASYREIISRHPRHAAALNNLAGVLTDRGCHTQAVAIANRALAVAKIDQPGLVEPITETLRTLPASAGDEDRCRQVDEAFHIH